MSSTTAAAAATKTPPRPQSSHSQPRHLIHSSHVRPQQQIQNPNTTTNSHTTPYPLASTGRGYIPRPSLRPADPLTYPPLAYGPLFTSPRPHLDYNHAPTRASSHPHPSLHHASRQHPTHFYAPSTVSAPIKGVPVSGDHVKVASSPSPASDSNGYKNTRDRSRDDSFLVTVKDRKVRISKGASLYALCRSWLRNGLPDEIQPQYGDNVKSLPRPLPVLDTHSPKKEECEEEEAEKEEEDEGLADQLSPKEILKRHVKRAKKVRARLREERLKRIARYKTRLALLLPPHVEQLINAAAAGN